MTNQVSNQTPQALPPPARPIGLLLGLSILIALAAGGTLVCGGMIALYAGRSDASVMLNVAIVAAVLAAVGSAGMLWALLWLLRRLPAAEEPMVPADAPNLASRAATLPGPGGSSAQPARPAEGDDQTLREISDQLAELRGALMPEPPPAEGVSFPSSVFEQARAAVGGEDPPVAGSPQHDDTLAADQAAQTARAFQQITELMSMARFDEARRQAEALARQFPDAAEGQALLQRVDREAHSYDRQQRQRLYDTVDQLCLDRRYRPALAAAEQLLETFGHSVEAAEVAARLDMLRANARLEEARELRNRVRDLIVRRRYPEALPVAEDLVRRFGETQAASELRTQLDRLRELASKASA
ncbi:MAG: hypothetical protein ACYS8X_09650 [Planctomycetota bacterium]